MAVFFADFYILIGMGAIVVTVPFALKYGLLQGMVNIQSMLKAFTGKNDGPCSETPAKYFFIPTEFRTGKTQRVSTPRSPLS